MHSAIVITARMLSSRLPGKMMLPLPGGMPVIEFLARRAISSGIVSEDRAILCTSTHSSDDVLENTFRNLKLPCTRIFRGSLNNRLKRWLDCVKLHGLDFIINMDGDDLFCGPELLAVADTWMRTNPKIDVLVSPRGTICGAFTYAIRNKALAQMFKDSNGADIESPEVLYDKYPYRIETLPIISDYSDSLSKPEFRFTLDYEEDYRMFQQAITDLGITPDTLLVDIVRRMKKTEIAKMNISRHSDFIARQLQQKYLVRCEIGGNTTKAN